LQELGLKSKNKEQKPKMKKMTSIVCCLFIYLK